MKRRVPRFGVAGLAVLVVLGACAGRPEGIEPVTGFDPARYQGTWYEVFRLDHPFERGLNNVTAEYRLRDDGKLDVINRGLDRAACEWDVADGTASFQEGPDVASLSVTFFWPFSGAYNVFALDRENYRWAAVAGPSRDYLWILSREPDLPPGVRSRIIEQAAALGFPVSNLLRVDQRPPGCNPDRF